MQNILVCRNCFQIFSLCGNRLLTSTRIWICLSIHIYWTPLRVTRNQKRYCCFKKCIYQSNKIFQPTDPFWSFWFWFGIERKVFLRIQLEEIFYNLWRRMNFFSIVNSELRLVCIFVFKEIYFINTINFVCSCWFGTSLKHNDDQNVHKNARNGHW